MTMDDDKDFDAEVKEAVEAGEDIFQHTSYHTFTKGSYKDFSELVRNLLEGAAAQKSYNRTGVDGRNDLYDFVSDIAGDGHSLGEIVYKVKRFAAKKNPEDLLKIAAWAFLVWRKHQGDDVR